MPLKVIGTGFGRTGTGSMRLALNVLGFGPTHHMFEVIASDKQKQLWLGLVKGAKPNWDDLLEGYSSCVDWPSAFYWKELIKLYPKAHVLLTWRTPESWWKSFESTILQVIKNPDESTTLGALLITEHVFGGRPDDRKHAIAIYENHVEEVIATVPEHQLLVYKIGDGWGPLCQHLGVAIPDQEYPNSNAKNAFFDKLNQT